MEKTYDSLKLENQLCFPLYVASRKIIGFYTPHLKKLGITYTQYLVFMVLWEKDGITVGELGEKLYLDSGTLSPVIKKMENKGFLVRTRSSRDERVVRITLTQKGNEMKERAVYVPECISSCLHISGEDAASLYKILYLILSEEN